MIPVDIALTSLTVLTLLVVILGLGTWIFVGLLAVSILSLMLAAGFSDHRVGVALASIVLRASSSWELSAIPLFVWVGEILFKAGFSARLFRGLAPLVDWMPGRLLHTNVVGCTLFAAVSGSSAATTATIGRITLTELRRRGYDESLAVGSLAGAGSLGLLIPPSLLMIVYGVLAEVSIARLFAAGVLPGLMMAGLFMGWVMLKALANPAIAPKASDNAARVPLWRSLWDLFPIFALIAVVLGSIYSGIATPSEAAAVGVILALALTAVFGQLSWDLIRTSLEETVLTSAMIVSILISAAFLSTAAGYLHLPQELASAITALNLNPYVLVALIAVFYLLGGMVLDGISLTVMTLPIVLPLITGAGFDPLWFGVFLVIMVEIGQITPPVGFNLYVLQGVTGHTLGQVAKWAVPFFLLMCLGATILTALPEIALWAPSLIGR